MTTIGCRVFGPHVLTALLVLAAAAPAQPELLTDIHTGIGSRSPSSNPAFFTELDVFAATDLDGGRELYVGRSPATVRRLADIRPGTEGSSPRLLTSFRSSSRSWVYFSADDGVHGRELWRTDRTAAGTQMVIDLRPGAGSSNPTELTVVTASNGEERLYFAADDGTNGRELWRTDGSALQRLSTRPGRAGSDPADLRAAPNRLFFTADDGTTGRELWISYPLGVTRQVVDLYPGSTASNPDSLSTWVSSVFFAADTPTRGRELWVSDGTATGTRLVRDINLGSSSSNPIEVTTVTHKVFFLANVQQGSAQLWVTQPSTRVTTLIRQFNWASSGSGPARLTKGADSFIGSWRLYFTAWDATHGEELWISDGTAAGTRMIEDIRPGPTGSQPRNLHFEGRSQGRVFFSADDGTHGRELWGSIGSQSNTTLLGDIQPGGAGSDPNAMFAALPGLGPDVVFAADDGNGGFEPWSWDFSSGIAQMGEINFTTADSTPRYLTDVSGTTYFVANEGGSGPELWRTDGTAANTRLLKDIRPGTNGSFPTELVLVGNTLFFRANDGVTGTELYKSDGTTAGTVRVKDIRPGGNGSTPRYLTPMGDTLYFAADDGSTGRELWRSDGTAAGTTIVRDIWPGSTSGDPVWLTRVGQVLYFNASQSSYGAELWRSEGQSSNTRMVRDIRPGTTSSSPSDLTAAGSWLYFVADDGTSGRELWRSGGGASSTTLVHDIASGNASSVPDDLTANGTTVYFSAADSDGRELWRTNFPSAVQVRDIRPGAASSSPRDLAAVGGRLFFRAYEDAHGAELWKSDGTATGTRMVKDIRSGTNSSVPRGMTALGSRHVYFVANDGSHGDEPWVSDGSPGSARRIADVNPGAADSDPDEFHLCFGELLFVANDGAHGRELWHMLAGATSQQVGGGCSIGIRAPTLTASDPVMGTAIQLNGSGGWPRGIAFVVLSLLIPTPTPLGSGCYAYFDVGSFSVLDTPLMNSVGEFQTQLFLPAIPGLIGLTVPLQAVLMPSQTTLGYDLTNGIYATLGF